MMCCGSRRTAWRNAPATSSTTIGSDATSRASRAQGAAGGPFPSVVLTYQDGAAIRVRGPVTGRRYEFSDTQPSQPVDTRDAAVLTRNSGFRRVGA